MLTRFRRFLFQSRLRACLFAVLVGWATQGLGLAIGWDRPTLLELAVTTGGAVLWGLAAFSAKRFVAEGYAKQEARKAARLAKQQSA